MTSKALVPMKVFTSNRLRGLIRASGDKSISHRALIVAALTAGRSHITGLLTSDDVRATIGALKQFGVNIFESDKGSVFVDGVGLAGFMEPSGPVDLGNSGTATRLLMGVAAGNPIKSVFVGDASLSTRPMDRVITPLKQMGAKIDISSTGGLPVIVEGSDLLLPIKYNMPVASAQVKSCILLAGLHAPGITTIIEGKETRDHTERLLKIFGAEVQVEESGSEYRISIVGQPELSPQELHVAGDPSSAAFPLVAALITEDSEVCVEGVGINKTRTGLLDCLRQMGADIQVISRGVVFGEPVADITARSSKLTGVDVPEDYVPRMIDEYPILAVAAAHAEGETNMHGLAELRVKESDRFRSILEGLANFGVGVRETGDSLTIEGRYGVAAPKQSVAIKTYGDHRIAMAFAVMGLTSGNPVIIDDVSMVATSYPKFREDMVMLGAVI